MGSKINRGFMFYLLLVLGLLLGAFLICVVIMIFVPEFQPFGLKYFNENNSDVRIVQTDVYTDKESEAKNTSANMSNYVIKNIEVNANIHSVKVFKSNNIQTNYDQFVVIYSSKTSGFTTGEIAKSEISVKYYINSSTLVIDAAGPEGFLSFGESASITIQIPPSYDTSNIELTVNANRNITIGDEYSKSSNLNPSTLALKSVKLNTKNAINITQYTTIGATSRGDCAFVTAGDVKVNTIVKANNLKIDTGESSVKFNNEGESFDLTGDLTMTTQNTFVYLGSVKADSVYLSNQYGKVYLNGNIEGNIFVNADSLKCDYEFKNINGTFVAGSYLDDKFIEGGTLTIEEITGESTIAFSGEINIKKINALTKIKNTSGAVNVVQIAGAVDVKTVDGNINLGNSENKIGMPVIARATGNGKVVAYFSSFEYSQNIESEISTKSGEIEIHLLKNMNKNITATTTSSLTYLGVEIEPKTGTWVVGVAKSLKINSEANVTIVNK